MKRGFSGGIAHAAAPAGLILVNQIGKGQLLLTIQPADRAARNRMETMSTTAGVYINDRCDPPTFGRVVGHYGIWTSNRASSAWP